ncbi:hypothetical protein E3P77_01551 [Wallemia ichthyophaga]|uniref:Vacuolar protein sorting-associated protein 35 n=1 Tax=Wallemia ichthyophaga (strain EXF-994 / CBS 113033) TaxID=1299270 RepID=R9ARM2_WALI9|nr:Vacuolar protein sorting-associated protein 35 [Wallemia ichthyophaga EXF-994]TIA72878.1 hypothetical protein E3P91_01733 [Wallemia ichthyophaga]EOR02721.1 Vacuolar protein sorting-associated protein 35 [Wallemia ichthyophaga EXF-994]TIB01663.1 hypothetical protein E3P94_01697 [Wallemia ichthyophaga]TIB34566.1 hypothetical protein E3P84_01740 [Wallemia ichthyophaga]TIB41731.1 hypothetical protein E3P83_01734 [Wallemia ichthyophaga]
MDEPKLLIEALSAVKTHQIQMKKCLDSDELIDAFKSASAMLSELRTSSLGPKAYYELYMSIFDSLRFLSTYLYDAHMSSKHHLADLYELVQYASNIIPRLYLMITVASVYMSVPDAPVREIIKDIMEMSRGVQHPIRGLFLRHYLSGQTRDYLPVTLNSTDKSQGTLNDSIAFILSNFIEMNKLWVRLQHQGHSRDRERRELERKELRILVGTNLVRLSQLEELDLHTYQSVILPNILEQVVNCRDVIAQEYLMEVVIQVFPDEFQLNTLTPFLTAASQLNTRVNIKQIVISLIDRLSQYARREAEQQSPEDLKQQDVEIEKRLQEKVRAKREGEKNGSATSEKTSGKGKGREEEVEKYRGIPHSVKLFEMFWEQIVRLIDTRPDLSMQDITALLGSLLVLSLNCYPDRLEYVDQVLSFTQAKLDEVPQHSPATVTNVLALLRAPIGSYKSMLTLLALTSYAPLLRMQPYHSRKSVAQDICRALLDSHTIVSDEQDVGDLLDLCAVLISDAPHDATDTDSESDMELASEQGSLARLIHLFHSDDPPTQFALLRKTGEKLGRGGRRIVFTFPTLVTRAIQLSRSYAHDALFAFIHQSIFHLHVLADTPEDCARLFIRAAAAASTAEKEKEKEMGAVAYELFSEALLLVEEQVVSSKYQMRLVAEATRALQRLEVNAHDYATLADKLINLAAKMVKKSHQAESLMVASGVYTHEEDKLGRVLGRAADIASHLIDPLTSAQVYVDILDTYLMYLEDGAGVESVANLSNAANGVVECISTKIDQVDAVDNHPISVELKAPSTVDVNLTVHNVVSHFKRTLEHIHRKKSQVPAFHNVNIAGPCLRYGIHSGCGFLNPGFQMSTPNSVERHLRRLSDKDKMVMRRSLPIYLVIVGVNCYLQYFQAHVLLEHRALHWVLELSGCYLTLVLFKGVLKMLGVVRGDVGLTNAVHWRFTADYGIKAQGEKTQAVGESKRE